jgi:hypothetical protein
MASIDPKLFTELDVAIAEMDAAETAYRSASSRQTAATNRLNGAQKAIDTAMNKLKAEAARGTDWQNTNRQKQLL